MKELRFNALARQEALQADVLPDHCMHWLYKFMSKQHGQDQIHKTRRQYKAIEYL